MAGILGIAGGLALVVVGQLLAQAEGAAETVAPWATTAGVTGAVAALVYIARLMANGKLVAVNTAELLAGYQSMVTAQAADNSALKDLLEEHRAALNENTRVLGRIAQQQARPRARGT